MEHTVFFRAFEPEDAILIHRWKNDDELNRLTVGLNKRTSFEEDQQWVINHKDHHPYYAYWAICACDSGEMIGYASLINIHYINRSAEFGGIMIGNKKYQDGFAWIESYLFVYEYAFERLGLNRLYGTRLFEHKMTQTIGGAMYTKIDGILRQAVYKNGQFHDLILVSLLREEYFEHKQKGDYEVSAIIKRIRKLKKEQCI